MAENLRGDYFFGEFQSTSTSGRGSGLDSPDEEIKKFCPADLKNHIWTCHVKHSHIDKVIESSVEGFRSWRKLTLDERSEYLRKYKNEVTLRCNDIARAIAYETGKPLWEALTEAQALPSKVDVTLNESRKRIDIQHIHKVLPDADGTVVYKPIGPCLIIGPFNFPCHLANGQILAALLTGNSIIFKPSEKTVYSTQIMIECFHKAGFPRGVINFINGTGEVARRLIQERAIRGVYFTGSKEVGKSILKSCVDDFNKLVALEMGGKNTSIVHKDAKLDHAMSELLKACFLTAGQRCTSTSIVAIHRSIKDKFISQFHSLSKKIIIDHPIEHEKEPFMGPLIDQKSLETYLLFMGMAKREGFEEVMRGKALQKKFEGHYVSPSIHYIEKPERKSVFFTAELFGPNVIFVPYEEIDEAIQFANMGEYGLASAVFSEDETIYKKCIQDIDAGLLNWNRSTVGASAKLPFGGVKNSGNYRPAAVSMIDHTVYTLSALEVKAQDNVDLHGIKGLEK